MEEKQFKYQLVSKTVYDNIIKDEESQQIEELNTFFAEISPGLR